MSSQLDAQQLLNRIERLEKRNRLLTGFCLILPVLAIVGWQSAPGSIRAKKLEIVDERGVPLITLAATRDAQGGSVVMRDAQGEKRSWWEVGPEMGAFTMTSSKPDATNDTTLGLQVGPKNGRMSIISKNGALLSANIEEDSPRVELYNAKGATVFAAPVRSGKGN